MASPLSNLFDNLAEGIHNIICTNCTTCYLEHTNAKDDSIEYKCLCCNKNYQKKLRKDCSIDINLLTTISMSLFCCCKKVLMHG